MAGSLEGIKILDFTTLLPGPYATMILSDLGADVVRVVSESRPDLVNFLPPFLPGTGVSAAVGCLGRGKRCLSLNLKDPRAAGIVHRLLSRYDVVIEQFRPGVMAKLGLDYPSLKKVNPGIIYCSLTGYGQTGPLSGRAGHDINYLALSGMMSYSGRAGSGPSLLGMQVADVASGSVNAVIGILGACIHRMRTGQGQHVDVSMTDGMIAFHAMTGACFLAGGPEPEREKELLNGGTLYDFYETKDGGFIAVGSIEPAFFLSFCGAIGRPDLAGEGIASPDAERIKREIRDIIRTRTRDEWREVFSSLDACVEPVLTLAEALESDHARARGLVVDIDVPGGGQVRQVGSPIRFSETKQEYGTAGAAGGIHTVEILTEAGFNRDEIDALERSGVLT